MRIVLAKMGLDGHDKGLKIVARTLKDAGMDIIYLGLRQSAKTIAAVAKNEKVDAIGISNLSGTHLSAAKHLMKELKQQDINPKVIFGGTIIEEDIDELKEIGVSYVFGVETALGDIIEGINKVLGIDNKENKDDERFSSISVKKECKNEIEVVSTVSGIPVDLYYDENSSNGEYVLGQPGQYPYTRGSI